jgi:hypothetical protein
VNCASGDFWHTFDDFSIPGRGVPLDFTRTYSSSATATDGPFGLGWTDSYNMSLVTDGAGNVTINEENGTEVMFTPDGGGYNAPSYVLATLTANPDSTYTFERTKTGIRYLFSNSGQLLSETDRNGNTTQLNYTSGQLA